MGYTAQGHNRPTRHVADWNAHPIATLADRGSHYTGPISGRVMVKVEPFSGIEVTEMAPPMDSAIALQILRPKPLLPKASAFFVCDLSA